MKPKRIYLDYAASTPADPAVLKAMEPYWNSEFGNPGSIHSFGQAAQNAVDEAREAVAKAIGADFHQVIFTGSATEANNLALRGAVKATRFMRPKVIMSGIEHESVQDTAREMRSDGAEVIYIPVDKNGFVDAEKIAEALDEQTVLVSVMYVQNEIGSIQPISEIGKMVKDFRKEKNYPLLHTDAAQAFGYFDCNVNKLGVDLMTLSGQKIYGPKGIGALYARNPGKLSAVITGGGQEFNLRSGTENVPALVGFGKAAELAIKERVRNSKNVGALKDRFWKGLKKFYPEAETNGSAGAPHILNVYFPTEYAGDLLVKLDLAGIAVSAGSACSARSFMPSYVLQALGFPQERVRGSLRFSFGKGTSPAEVDAALAALKGILNK